MRKRYCETILQKHKPCTGGWGTSYGPGDNEELNIEPFRINKSCTNDPMEKHCGNIVNTDTLHCPVCEKKIQEV